MWVLHGSRLAGESDERIIASYAATAGNDHSAEHNDAINRALAHPTEGDPAP